MNEFYAAIMAFYNRFMVIMSCMSYKFIIFFKLLTALITYVIVAFFTK